MQIQMINKVQLVSVEFYSIGGLTIGKLVM